MWAGSARKLVSFYIDSISASTINFFAGKETGFTIANEIDIIRARKQKLLVEKAANEGYKKRIQELKAFINDSNNELTEYDDKMVRKYIKEIRVFDDRFHVFFKAGIDVEIPR